MSSPLISICIPAYKRVDSLTRLLDSISKQNFKNYEIVITDDSDDESVAHLVKKLNLEKVRYFRNPVPLGSPENWNQAMSRAGGDWIKLMHDDDWFANENSLNSFAEATTKTDAQFIFSGFENVDTVNSYTHVYVLSKWHNSLLKDDPLSLFKQNFIGHPSTTLIRNVGELKYDARLMWMVDIEFYIRVLKKTKSFYNIPKPLIKIGISNTQLTKIAFRNPSIEIPENLYLLNKFSPVILRNIFVFDYFWRLMRNLSIRSISQLQQFAKGETVPRIIEFIIAWQRQLPLGVLKFGPISKSLMFSCYWYCRIIKIL